MFENILLRVVIQRVSFAEVIIDGLSQGKIEKGLVVLFGVGDNEQKTTITEDESKKIIAEFKTTLEKLADKLMQLRVFEDSEGKMNLALNDIKGGIYLISQFTLFGDCRKGNRPSFTQAAKPILANPMYQALIDIIKKKSSTDINICTGIFAADMKVHLYNDGPVTLILDAGVKGIL